ncbi:Ketosteroid isomerase-related protein [Polaromonas sp. YR568]|uniref:nuclear transport factor 2 family protein n=1 Tax=Polaromonas sp. YR568 TaxID=1855301 RepID=UPI0008E96EF5|nr:nuclear transport factor 2 family protein [Polaromonas sp. YR568]SFU70654.1 Ketosteroid isomerase-related protein [Polaromonas sp. YR568]
MTTPIASLVRRYFSAYETKDRLVLEGMLHESFAFSSPLDDRIDRAAYFARCWPNSRTLRRFTVEKIFEQGDEAFVRYEAESTTGKKFRNTEWFRFEGGKLMEVQVFFGRDTRPALPAAATSTTTTRRNEWPATAALFPR